MFFSLLGDEKNFQADVRTYVLIALDAFDVQLLQQQRRRHHRHTRNRRKCTTHKVCSIFFLMDNNVGKEKEWLPLMEYAIYHWKEKEESATVRFVIPLYTIRSFILLFLLLLLQRKPFKKITSFPI